MKMTCPNQKTRITASIIGVLLAMGGMFNHGIFEILQGSTPTNGFFIEAIGEANRFWIHGTEAAVTIIPNFLITGILVILTALSLIVWSVRYIHVKNGTSIFLALLVLMTLFGGGIGHILLFLPAWAFATRINKSLDWWKRNLPSALRKFLASAWMYILALTVVMWLTVMEMGIFGWFPGQDDPDKVLNIVFIFLFGSSVFVSLSFISAFARDIEEQNP